MKTRLLTAAIVAALLSAASTYAAAQDVGQQKAAAKPAHQDSTAPQTTPATKAKTKASTTESAQQEIKTLQAVVVTGIVQSQVQSIRLKRLAPDIQDSITAENIGQLPDFTIADSLSRITGVQIQRSAGEGSVVSVRGLPEVGMTLNGESFISAGNIVSNQPDFTSVPSQLFSGVDVIKSSTAAQNNAGISGSINLRTRRPFDLKRGWTFAGAGDYTYGGATKKYQPEGNFLVGYTGEKWGALISVADSKIDHNTSGSTNDESGGRIYGENAASALSSAGFLGAFSGAPIPPDIHQLGNGNVDVNGDGKADGAFFASQAMTGNARNDVRQRLGINASVQGDLGGGFTVTADGFFTRLNDEQFNNEFEIFSQAYEGATIVPLVSQPTGDQVLPFGLSTGNEPQEFYTTQVYKKWPGDIETLSSADNTHSLSRNFDLALDYDNGGPFTGSFRLVNGTASQLDLGTYMQFTDADGTAWPNSPLDPVKAAPGLYVTPDGLVPFNPNGIAPNTIPVTYDMRGTVPSVTLPPELAAVLADPNNYRVKGVVSDGNSLMGTAQHVVRADGHYNFRSGFGPFDSFTLDFGARNSIRTANEMAFRNMGALYAGDGASDPGGCLVRWEASDVVLDGGGKPGACTAGNDLGFYRANTYIGMTPSQLPDIVASNFHYYQNLGGVQGMDIWSLDPHAMEDPVAFQKALYPNVVSAAIPSSTWNLSFHQTSFYAQADFGGALGSVTYAGNAGVRAIHSYLNVVSDVVGASQPYGAPPAENGTLVTTRKFWDVLPRVNLEFDLTPKLVARFAYTKQMMPLSLNQWGGGLNINYQIDTSTPGSTRFVPVNGTSSGNPNLDPWRSTNYNVSLEYYFNKQSVLSVAAFDIKVKSFIQSGSTLNCNVPNLDGTTTGNCIAISGPVQGEGRSLKGIEADFRTQFSYLPGLLANTGMEINATYSPSNAGGHDIAGNAIPFQGNAKKSGNLVLWYQDRKLQARVAYNYQSRLAMSSDFSGVSGLEVYQAPTGYVDASVSYQIAPEVQVFLQGTNLTNEHQRLYLVYPSQVASTTLYERRYMLGVRVKL